ncbi:ArnT family glycosyltransferase [Neisseria lisongii]|uniref:Glycosyltransferase family 39 protein n=1 Tax=Neisseria lisongii TaxID=2912188 RepID=A0AAW5AJC2_9NEIS|nr:glycosyltransferase family 39 protein [Neisseria lisongii]MCF7529963.1 glycosyltransferase family 39 protein [Neisseria lisongii]
MLTYTPPSASTFKTREKPWLLLLMAFAWLWPGVFSHDLWHPNEPTLFTAVEAAVQSGAYWHADVLGRTDFSVSPVYLWTAATLVRLFSPWAMDAYAAARLASVLFTAVGLFGCGAAGFHFLGRHHGRSVVLALIGCVGLLPMAHFLNGTSLTFAALSLILCGFSLAGKKVIAASLLLGGGWVLLSLAEGWLPPLSLMALALLLPLHAAWRFKRYWLTLFGAFAVALPLLPLYPFALRLYSSQEFAVWRDAYLLGIWGGLQPHNLPAFQTASLLYYLKNLLWFTFPAWPLAVWSGVRMRITAQAWGVLAAAWLALVLLLLSFDPQPVQERLVWLLPPLALLAAAQLDGLRRGAAAFLNWFGIMTFGLLAAFLWLGFAAANYGWPAKLAERAAYFSPYYLPDIDTMPMVVAALFTSLWLLAITRKNIRGRQAVTNWAAGVTLAWALLMTLLLPWLDAAKSHAPVVRQMEASLSAELKKEISDGLSCISVAPQAETARMAWAQYGHLPLTLDEHCTYRLVEQPKTAAAPTGWRMIWQGARPRNKTEGFALLEKL